MYKKCGSKSIVNLGKKYNVKQLKIGEQVELEHTCSRSKARRIAKDHLSEHENYYKELQKMEKALDKGKRNTRVKFNVKKAKMHGNKSKMQTQTRNRIIDGINGLKHNK